MKRILILTIISILILGGCVKENPTQRLNCVEVLSTDKGSLNKKSSISISLDGTSLTLKSTYAQAEALSKGIFIDVEYNDTFWIKNLTVTQGCRKQ